MIQNQNYIKAILDHSPESIVLIGLNHEILAFNKTIQIVLEKYFSKAIELGDHYPDYVVEGSKKLYFEAFQKARQGEAVLVQNQTIGPDFSMWFEYRVLPVYDDSGKMFGISLSAKNIDKEKKAEEEIKKLNESLENKVKERTIELQESLKDLESFSYTVSHDLRAPLRSINGYASLLEKNYSSIDDDGRMFIQSIIRNSTDMGHLIDDLLDLSRLGRKELSTEDVDMNVLVKSIIEEYEFNQKDTVKIETAELLPAKCDASLIKQVWVNLISNAIKYSQYRPEQIIAIGSTVKDGTIEYYIKDNGAGFDMNYYDKLFGVFQRLPTSEKFEGTGIGLATVQKIIRKHHQTIRAESKVNQGATFYFTLPAIKS